MKFPWLMYGEKELDVYNFIYFISELFTQFFGAVISMVTIYDET
jgi:hypothetical protein